MWFLGGLSGGGGRGLREVGLWEEGIIFGSGHCSCMVVI